MVDILLITQDKTYSKLLLADGKECKIKVKPSVLLERLCNKCGCSLKGRMDAFKYLTNSFQKPCIMVNDGLIFIPTTSISNSFCEYIQYNRIVWIKEFDNKTLILFDNGLKREVDCSYRTIKNQIKRCDLFMKELIKANSYSVEEMIKEF